MKTKFGLMALITGLLVAANSAWAGGGGEQPIEIHGVSTAIIPISMSGFTGEVESALRFDLEVAGFKVVAPGAAKYAVTGSNDDKTVKGQLNQGNSVRFAREYTSALPRREAHYLADEIVKTITGVDGVAKTTIAFKVTSGQNSEIYISDYDGHNAQAVTHDNTIVAAPCWVPRQSALYYTSYKLGNPDVFYHNFATGERRAIASYSGLNSSAAVSPDGRRVALILSKAGSPNVYVCNADGKDLKQLTFTKEGEASPCWSPDGTKICFSSRVSARSQLYIVPASGGAMKHLATPGVSNTTEPDWSPDGASIIFTAQMGGFKICTVPAAGGEVAIVCDGADACWAPNSRTAIFCRSEGNRETLSLLDVPTKQVKNIARISGNNSQPSWAR